jgi:predicted amidophosphoribosyltransferase
MICPNCHTDSTKMRCVHCGHEYDHDCARDLGRRGAHKTSARKRASSAANLAAYRERVSKAEKDAITQPLEDPNRV